MSANYPIVKSRKVYIKVREKIGMPGSETINTITRSISSVYGANKKPLNPLTWEECETWLPSLLNVTKEDLKFRDAVENYFINIQVPIATNEAYELEVGMQYKTEEDYSNENVKYDDRVGTMTGKLLGTPINVENYILYRFALQSPKVANKEEYIYSSNNIWFYIEDLASKKEDNEKRILTKNKATALFHSKVSADNTLIIGIINSCLDFIQIPTLTESLTLAEKMTAIDSIIEKKPNLFIKLASDENLPYRSIIQLALTKGILTKIANTQLITFQTESSIETLGNGIEEAIAFLKVAKNEIIKNKIELKIKALR